MPRTLAITGKFTGSKPLIEEFDGKTIQYPIAEHHLALAFVVGTRYLAIGAGATELHLFAGMLAAVVISIQVFLSQGARKANETNSLQR